jgi:hypothetical protein
VNVLIHGTKFYAAGGIVAKLKRVARLIRVARLNRVARLKYENRHFTEREL